MLYIYFLKVKKLTFKIYYNNMIDFFPITNFERWKPKVEANAHNKLNIFKNLFGNFAFKVVFWC